MRPINTLFIIADGGRARLVRLSRETGDYQTIREHLRGPLPRDGEPVAVFQRFGHGRATTRRRAEGPGPVDEAFIRRVAEDATKVIKTEGFQGIVLIAPERMIGGLRRRLGASAEIVGELAKDLTKVRDHDLAAWLGAARLARQSA